MLKAILCLAVTMCGFTRALGSQAARQLSAQEAFAMGMHSRVGANSVLHGVTPYIIEQIIDYTLYPLVVRNMDETDLHVKITDISHRNRDKLPVIWEGDLQQSVFVSPDKLDGAASEVALRLSQCVRVRISVYGLSERSIYFGTAYLSATTLSSTGRIECRRGGLSVVPNCGTAYAVKLDNLKR